MKFKNVSLVILSGMAGRVGRTIRSKPDFSAASERQFWLQRAGQALKQAAGALILWNCNKQLRVNESAAGCLEPPQPLCDGVLCFYRANLINVALGSVLCIFKLSYHIFPMYLLHKSKHFYAPFKMETAYLNCLAKVIKALLHKELINHTYILYLIYHLCIIGFITYLFLYLPTFLSLYLPALVGSGCY